MADDRTAGRDAARGQPSVDYTGPVADVGNLAVVLSNLARSLQHQYSVEDTLHGIVTAAVDTVPGARHAAISMIERRREVRTRAGTDALVYEVDQAQYDTGEGPCLDSLYDQRTVRLSDLTTDPRWPKFTRRAAELRVGSMLAFQLYVQRDNLGALNLYSPHVDAFDDESEQVGLLFAAHAGVALAEAQHQQQLTEAMAVRDLIGQAKGILMERHRVTGDQAFALLIRASQTTNTKLVEVATHLVSSGELVRRDRR